MWKRAEALSLVGLVAVSVVSMVVIVVAEMSRGCITRWTSSRVVVSNVVIVVAENMRRGSITRWTSSSSSSGIKDSNRSSREYEQRLAKRKMETQGPPLQHSYALSYSSRF